MRVHSRHLDRWITKRVPLFLAIASFCAIGTSAQRPTGSYTYYRHHAQGLEHVVSVAFHPDGSYAVALERYNAVNVVDWNTRMTTRYDLTPAMGAIYWDDLAFDPSGQFAVLVGYQYGTAAEGVAFRLDDAMVRSGGTATQVFSEYTDARNSSPYAGIEYPRDGGFPVLLSRHESNVIAFLQEFDPVSGNLTGLYTGTNTNGGAVDLAFVNNPPLSPVILVACGINGTDIRYYAEDVDMWFGGIAPGSLGNVIAMEAHPDGDYALIVDSSTRIHRFEGGALASGTVPSFPAATIWGLGFRPGGGRALLVGRGFGLPMEGTVHEYRHDLYACQPGHCGFLNVSIPGFADPPFYGTFSTYLHDVAWHPREGGGLIVGGQTTGPTSQGYLIEFQVEFERPSTYKRIRPQLSPPPPR